MDTSDFDISRPHRSIIVEEIENSLADESVHDVPVQNVTTYQLVQDGSDRGRPKLVSSDGYSYVKKRTLGNGTIDWRCSFRPGGGSGCLATVKQIGETFTTHGRAHIHEPRPGLLTSIQVKSQVVEETDMWRQREKEIKRHDSQGSNYSFLKDRGVDMRYEFPVSRERRAHMDEEPRSTYWMKELYKAEEADNNRWGHSGYKELYPEHFSRSNSSSSDERERDRKHRDRQEKSKKMKRKKSRKRKHSESDTDSDPDIDREKDKEKERKKRKKKHKSKEKKKKKKQKKKRYKSDSDS